MMATANAKDLLGSRCDIMTANFHQRESPRILNTTILSRPQDNTAMMRDICESDNVAPVTLISTQNVCRIVNEVSLTQHHNEEATNPSNNNIINVQEVEINFSDIVGTENIVIDVNDSKGEFKNTDQKCFQKKARCCCCRFKHMNIMTKRWLPNNNEKKISRDNVNNTQ